MSNSQPQQTLADYVAIAISPALIMALVGTLVFFLVEVLLGPEYDQRLAWILFFFVFAAVLISRISMTSDIADRAPLYGLILGVLVWLALMKYVKYPADSRLAGSAWLIHAILIAIIWWSAHRLTWDSTLIDDNQDASGAGLLQVAGLDNNPQRKKGSGTIYAKHPPGRSGKWCLTPFSAPGKLPTQASADDPGKKSKREPGGFQGWITRWQKHREDIKRRPHAPGVWVVYFSLAALPLFGLGQSLIPPVDVERRRYAFWLMSIYVGSGLGLLVTTSFLNLRRYLRQRNLQMPTAMTGVWLTGGVLIITVLLLVGALVPRPNAEYPLVDLGGLVASNQLEKSRDGKGNGRAEDKTDNADGPGEGTGNKGSKDAGQGDPKDAEGKAGGPKSEGQPGGPQQQPPPLAPNLLLTLQHRLFELFKWLLVGLVGAVIAFLVLRALLRFLANFTHWASHLLKSFESWWDQLCGWWQRRLPEAVLDEPDPAAPPPPFAGFRDPFLSGEAERMSPAELVRHTFDALQAWAWERGLQRQRGETPLEFVERLATEHPALEKAALDLANLYAGLAYARRSPPPERVEALRRLWLLLHQMVERPMSASV